MKQRFERFASSRLKYSRVLGRFEQVPRALMMAASKIWPHGTHPANRADIFTTTSTQWRSGNTKRHTLSFVVYTSTVSPARTPDSGTLSASVNRRDRVVCHGTTEELEELEAAQHT